MAFQNWFSFSSWKEFQVQLNFQNSMKRFEILQKDPTLPYKYKLYLQLGCLQFVLIGRLVLGQGSLYYFFHATAAAAVFPI